MQVAPEARALRSQGAAQPLPRVRRGGVPRAGDARPWVHADRRHDGAAHRRRVRCRAARPPAADRGVGAAGERERGRARRRSRGASSGGFAATAALRDQAERLRAAGARLGKAWAKAWPPSCAAPVRSLLSESPGLCSPLVELRAARAAAIAAKRTHSRIKKRGGNITIVDSEEAWGDCRRDERGGWGGVDDHGEPIVAARDTCRQRCDGCVNCRFWSWSATTRECFWSRQCAAPPAPPMAKGKGSRLAAATAVLAKSSLASRAVFASSYRLHKEGDERPLSPCRARAS